VFVGGVPPVDSFCWAGDEFVSIADDYEGVVWVSGGEDGYTHVVIVVGDEGGKDLLAERWRWRRIACDVAEKNVTKVSGITKI
jgi:hypothetical protein